MYQRLNQVDACLHIDLSVKQKEIHIFANDSRLNDLLLGNEIEKTKGGGGTLDEKKNTD